MWVNKKQAKLSSLSFPCSLSIQRECAGSPSDLFDCASHYKVIHLLSGFMHSVHEVFKPPHHQPMDIHKNNF